MQITQYNIVLYNHFQLFVDFWQDEKMTKNYVQEQYEDR
jgi:hypothetical protein